MWERRRLNPVEGRDARSQLVAAGVRGAEMADASCDGGGRERDGDEGLEGVDSDSCFVVESARPDNTWSTRAANQGRSSGEGSV